MMSYGVSRILSVAYDKRRCEDLATETMERRNKVPPNPIGHLKPDRAAIISNVRFFCGPDLAPFSHSSFAV